MPRPVVPIASARALVARLVERDVPLADHVRAAGDAHPGRVAQRPALGDLVDLLGEHARIHDDTGADQVDGVRLQDSGRHQMEDGRLAVDDQRMTGVVAALEANDQLGIECEPIDDLALPFVAPLGAHGYDCGHSVSSRGPGRTTRPGPPASR